MTDDGVSLQCAAHPRPVWYRRPWSWLRCQWTYWCGFRRGSVEKIEITLAPVCAEDFSTEPFRYRLRVPPGALNNVYGTPGK